MASIDERTLSTGEISYRVRWRQDGSGQVETFSTRPKADRFRLDVEEAGNRWPPGWVKGVGYVQQNAEDYTVHFIDGMDRFINQLTGIQSDTKRRYRNQVRTLAAWECPHPVTKRPYKPFNRLATEITDEDVRQWVNTWPRSVKTRKNYLYALLAPGLNWMFKKKMIREVPTDGIRLDERAIRPDVRYMTEDQFRLLHGCVPQHYQDLIEAKTGTGLRFGEITALWPAMVDRKRRRVTVNKAWKRKGDDGEWQLDPTYVTMVKKGLLQPKHETMRGHYLGGPKTEASWRTIPVGRKVMYVLDRQMEALAEDDFIFTTPTGLPIHNGDFYEGVWRPAVFRAQHCGQHVDPECRCGTPHPERCRVHKEIPRACGCDGTLAFSPRIHDCRHTYAVWLLSAGINPKDVQLRLGHDDLKTTTEIYGDILPLVSQAGDDVLDNILDGGQIRLVTPLAS